MKNYINKPDILKWYVYKILLIMRLTTVILMISILQVSAATVAQEFNYVKKGVSLIQIFKEIKKQTGYNIIWNEKRIAVTTTIDANFKKATIQDVLNKCLSRLPLSYSMDDKMVIIKEDKPSFRAKLADFFSSIDVRGRVVDENNAPLVGAVVKVKGTKQATSTNNNGEFLLRNVDDNAVLVISFLGYVTQDVKANVNIGSVRLVLGVGKLDEVEIVSTGYQNISKERATGSFTIVDNKLLNRAVSPDLMSRLKGVTNGLLMDRSGGGNTTGISVRGRSTLFSETQPLIVVDNFPFQGDINTINPNDIENVTILKDAAAASIWGTQAGNGVIVITTKKGFLGKKPIVAFNTNLTIGKKPDLYYTGQLSSSEYVDLERFLFDKGAYNGTLGVGYLPVSPVVELLSKARIDPSFAAEANSQIDVYRNLDYRKQVEKYFIRESSHQQYHLSVSGGGENQTYFFSGGYDKSLPNTVANTNNRVTLRAVNTYNLLKKKLYFVTDITLTKSNSENTNSAGYSPVYPYDQIADPNGNPLAVDLPGGLRTQYTDTAGNGKLLDWKFRPLQELREKNSASTNTVTNYRVLLATSYKIIDQLKFSINYQYFGSNEKLEQLANLNAFSTRTQINQYTHIGPTGQVSRAFPLGDDFTVAMSESQSHYGRAQMDYNQKFSKHSITALAGYEIRDDQSGRNQYQLYGYNQDLRTSIRLNESIEYKNYVTGTINRLLNPLPTQNAAVSRNVSLYGNASYAYNEKYIFSGSYRKDESNLFGVKANHKGVPLWSLGLSWNLAKESFFNLNWFSLLRLKSTYGFNGNVNRSVSAYLAAAPTGQNFYFANYYGITNPPNDALRWERVKNINFGLDFSTKDNRISGSLEYFIKNGMDLLGSSPVAPQTGVSIFTGNSANTSTRGIDIQINSRNLYGGFKWATSAVFNVARDKVTAYQANIGTNITAMSVNLTPIVGYPIRSVMGFRWNGLDGTGIPLGELNGVVSKDYISISNLTDYNQLNLFGSAVPTLFGSLLNTFSFRGFELSFNLTYKFNYFIRRGSVFSGSVAANSSNKLQDFAKRWRQPGDELLTNVPSIQYPNNNNLNDFYRYSSVLVEKGDHIRLQDIKFNYGIDKSVLKKMPFASLNIFAYANNLGVLWEANKLGQDPDLAGNNSLYPTPQSFALGLNISF